MNENWDFYLFDDQGAVSSNFLNMALAEDAPVPSHSVLGLVEIKMLTPRSDGLSADSEADALNTMEDAVVAATSAAGAIHCGRTTGRGVRTMAFYMPAAEEFKAAAHSILRAFPAYTYEIETKTDPDWHYYFDFLFPEPTEWERMKNAKVLRALADEGDILDGPREIDHWAFFESGTAADAYAIQIGAQGFKLRAPVEPLEDGGPFRVQFWRMDAPSHIDALTIRLADLARSLDGDYDGWECPVVRRPKS